MHIPVKCAGMRLNGVKGGRKWKEVDVGFGQEREHCDYRCSPSTSLPVAQGFTPTQARGNRPKVRVAKCFCIWEQRIETCKRGRQGRNHVCTRERRKGRRNRSKPKRRKGSEQVPPLFMSPFARRRNGEDAAREERVDGVCGKGAVEVPVGFLSSRLFTCMVGVPRPNQVCRGTFLLPFICRSNKDHAIL